jgi:hypothetical protein
VDQAALVGRLQSFGALATDALGRRIRNPVSSKPGFFVLAPHIFNFSRIFALTA